MNEGAEGGFFRGGGGEGKDQLAKRDSAAFFYPLDSQIQGWNHVEPLKKRSRDLAETKRTSLKLEPRKPNAARR